MPSFKNVWVNPQTRVLDDDGQIAVVEVSGMLCEWGSALAGLDGVTAVGHEAGSNMFVVKHNSELNDVVKAVDGVVILRRARRGLEKIHQKFSTTGVERL